MTCKEKIPTINMTFPYFVWGNPEAWLHYSKILTNFAIISQTSAEYNIINNNRDHCFSLNSLY